MERTPPLEQQFQYYWQNIPRIVQGFVVARAQFPESLALDGHGEELNTIFKLSCTCGSPLHSVLGHYVHNEFGGKTITVFVGPLLLRCETCSKRSLLLDTGMHGYDGEYGHGSATTRGSGAPKPGICDACGAAPHEMYVRFEYPDDLLDEAAPPEGKEPENFFSWFTLIGRCPRSGSYSVLADFECA